MQKKYYKIIFTLREPLAIGSGENQYSDSDLLRNSSGQPFIPGTSLCGCYRTIVGEQLANKYFGSASKTVKNSKNTNEESDQSSTESKIIVYDAELVGHCKTQIRDSVGLDEFKVSKEGAKFDFEMIEPGARFVTYLEQTVEDEDVEEDIGMMLASAFLEKKVCLGRKTMRGYGNVSSEIKDITYREFRLDPADSGDDLEEWLDFDLYAKESFSEKNKVKQAKVDEAKKKLSAEKQEICIDLSLRLRGGISIRRYTTELTENEENQPDYVQMFYEREKNQNDHASGKNNRKDMEQVPCIPGTSWAGAFRHRMAEFLPGEAVDEWFGMMKKENAGRKSAVRFSESIMTGGEWKVKTRNAIDRFTGGTVDGALYTEKAYFGGTTHLKISYSLKCVREGMDLSLWNKALAAVITDLDQGFLAVGGLTSVGHGLFQVESCKLNDDVVVYKYDKNSCREADSETPVLYAALVSALSEIKGVAK